MDFDFSASRVYSTRHFTAMQARLNSENHLTLDDSEGGDILRACFQCPFCYVDIDVPVLCIHLQEEHCFDVKNAVCPVCAENMGKDMIGHLTMQHSYLLKRRRKTQRSDQWTNSSAVLGKDLRELMSFLGVISANDKGNTTEYAPDPLLSPFIRNVAYPNSKDNQDTGSINDASTVSDMNSTKPSTSDEIQEQEYKEKNKRAEFFQQMICSTIFEIS